MQSFDVVVIGAGIVGLVQALSLQDSGLKVAIIDEHSPQAMPSGPALLRVSALTLATTNILRNLQVWQGIDQQRITPYADMAVWDKDSFGRIEFNAQSIEQNQLGFVVENQAIQASLWQRVLSLDFITVFSSLKIAKLALSAQGSFIHLSDDRMLSARLVIGADGANSLVRNKANFPLTFWDYDHHAIVATVKTALPHNNIARQVFTKSGPLAFLPLWDQHQCSIVWSQDEPVAKQLLALSVEEFNKSLLSTLDAQLGLCELISKRQSYPLTMRYARKWLSDGVVLVGDAAHTIHPLAGQGANLGLLDAVALAQQIKQIVADGKDFSRAKHLRPYERWRKTEAVKMIAAMQGFKQVFGSSHPAIKLLRDLGLSITNQLPLGKNALIKQAMGLVGELPKLAKVN